ncbi:TRAP transporter small permease subunit [Poseidonocella sp. HB161398]|uniref:TRAP transporter small permease subunit n=1 Tax=Poseidonocella sp. HB161398 TaxID=2320855 RepID=UPI0011083EAA|nr:TRAP transporter small permease subunit [Poseidonocella sp. HB161398]
MMDRILSAVDAVSLALSRVAQAVTVILVAAMLYEVAARYLFGAPTLWAFDISYMATGTLFVLGAAQALREDAHVRIDVLAARLPARLRRGIEAAVFLLALAPLFAMLARVAVQRAWRAWQQGEVESVSPWAPLMWPFYALLALGLAALALQIAVHGLRALAGRPDVQPET